jgi:NAD(P)-dependent dehydrogenase (short-subunit alcohol dehydrogenase family)
VNVGPGELALRQGLISHIVTAKHAAKAMMPARRGLIVQVTESDVLGGGGNPFAQAVKTALKVMALNMAAELRPHDVAAVAVTPGYLRSESMLAGYGVTEATWREAGNKDSNFLVSESPLYLGRDATALPTTTVAARTGARTRSTGQGIPSRWWRCFARAGRSSSPGCARSPNGSKATSRSSRLPRSPASRSAGASAPATRPDVDHSARGG